MRLSIQDITASAAIAAGVVSAGPALGQQVFAFEGMPHGQPLAAPIGPLNVRSLTPGGRLEAFDTHRRQTGLPQLEGPDDTPLPDRIWTHGNVSPLQNAGVVLRAAESSTGSIDTLITLEDEVAAATFDLLNVADPSAVEVTVIDAAGRSSGLGIDALQDPDHPAYQPGVAFGPHSNNRIGPFDASALGLSGVKHLRIKLPLDAAIDRVVLQRTRPGEQPIDLAALAQDATGGGAGGLGGGQSAGAGAAALLLSGGGGGGGSGADGDDDGTDGSNSRIPATLGPGPTGGPPNDPPVPTTNDPNDSTPVPTPSALAAGLALLAALGVRRRRHHKDDRPE
ncbi:MAG: MYXO-CTERM sorting domain-containing protein [Planctomycetota bacterium]